jgi:hypothetical protein
MTMTASIDAMDRARQTPHVRPMTGSPLRVRLLKPDRPRAIDRYIDYFGECALHVPAARHAGGLHAGPERRRHHAALPHVRPAQGERTTRTGRDLCAVAGRAGERPPARGVAAR